MKKTIILVCYILLSFAVKAQVSVVSILLQPFNVSPESMLAASLMNTGAEKQAYLISKLYNLNNEILLTVKSAPFIVKGGLNAGTGENRKATSVEYAGNGQANYIKTAHVLPSGAFKICVTIIAIGSEPDEFCDELQSEFNQYLYLVFPLDKEIISTRFPVLTWSHSEPFTILAAGESFRMIVAEMKDKQNPEEAITLNSPVMIKDYLTSHSLTYPYEAKVLEEGKRYAWKVEKLANGIVLNKTETWEFKIISADAVAEASYTALRKELDASFYTVQNNKIYFKFQEEYGGEKISCTIFNSLREPQLAKATNETEKKELLNYKKHGFNQYEIDLEQYTTDTGFYTLEVKNEKNEVFLLKFYVE